MKGWKLSGIGVRDVKFTKKKINKKVFFLKKKIVICTRNYPRVLM